VALEEDGLPIEGEEWGTARRDDAMHWISVYDELIGLHQHMLRKAGQSPAAVAAQRQETMERSLVRLHGRRDYWRNRWADLTGLRYEPAGRSLVYEERSAVLTPREAQLLETFLQHPSRTFSSRQLLQAAWGDEALSEEQVRTYIARLRQKLTRLGVRGQLRSLAREGYALQFDD
jgi:DNA-binding response OmpR family regulator